ncbi:MAG: hypothetical protein WBE48_17625 [Xanthobacteraceae bacterium]
MTLTQLRYFVSVARLKHAGGGRLAFCSLQSGPTAQDPAHDASNGGERDRSGMVTKGIGREDFTMNRPLADKFGYRGSEYGVHEEESGRWQWSYYPKVKHGTKGWGRSKERERRLLPLARPPMTDG